MTRLGTPRSYILHARHASFLIDCVVHFPILVRKSPDR